MTTEIAVSSNGTLALTGDQVDWTPVQRAALDHLGIAEAPPGDQQVFLHVAQRTGLDPFRRQVYLIGRNEKQSDGSYRKKWTIQTGIDGFRLIAEDHPQYAGTLDPEWCGEDGVWRETWTDRRAPVMARVKVLRHDRAHPITLPVRFNEFAATFKNGDLQGQWASKPAHMIAKVAESAALRKAFPRQLAGVYTDDEMAHVDNHGRGRRGAVIEQDAQPVTAAELTGQPAAETWDLARWKAEVDAAYASGSSTAVNDLWNRAARERRDDLELREHFKQAAARATRNAPQDVVDAEIAGPDPQDEHPAAPTAEDAAAVDEFFRHPGEDQA